MAAQNSYESSLKKSHLMQYLESKRNKTFKLPKVMQQQVNEFGSQQLKLPKTSQKRFNIIVKRARHDPSSNQTEFSSPSLNQKGGK